MLAQLYDTSYAKTQNYLRTLRACARARVSTDRARSVGRVDGIRAVDDDGQWRGDSHVAQHAS
jgi:hypothetical protein